MYCGRALPVHNTWRRHRRPPLLCCHLAAYRSGRGWFAQTASCYKDLLVCRYGLDTSQFGYDPAAAEAGAPPPPPLIPREDGGAAQRRCAIM